MNRKSTIVALLYASLVSVNCAAQTRNDEPKIETIPLDQIWAWKMPGTKNVGTLDAVKIAGTTEHPMVSAVMSGLGGLPKGKRAGPIFVVEGVGRTALENAGAVFKKEKKRADEVPADMELTLVFYAHSAGKWVHLVSVEKSAGLITVKYRFVNHFTARKNIHFALIPIGKFSPGVVQVKIEQQNSTDIGDRERPPIPEMERLVSAPFTFEVRK